MKIVQNEHQNGKGANFNRKYLPVKLVYHCKFLSFSEAHKREKHIQGWSHAKKQALVDGDFDQLSHLSKSKKHRTSGH